VLLRENVSRKKVLQVSIAIIWTKKYCNKYCNTCNTAILATVDFNRVTVNVQSDCLLPLRVHAAMLATGLQSMTLCWKLPHVWMIRCFKLSLSWTVVLHACTHCRIQPQYMKYGLFVRRPQLGWYECSSRTASLARRDGALFYTGKRMLSHCVGWHDVYSSDVPQHSL